MKNALYRPSVKQAAGKVDTVVQEYMDNLLGELFPVEENLYPEPSSVSLQIQEAAAETETDIPVKENTHTEIKLEQPEIEISSNTISATFIKPKARSLPFEQDPGIELKTSKDPLPAEETFVAETSVLTPNTTAVKTTEAETITTANVASKPVVNKPITEAKPTVAPVEMKTPLVAPASEVKKTVIAPTVVEPNFTVDSQIKVEPKKETETRFPNAPDWAQEAFDVLLFDVCGLKLAVPMESLGRIIKVEHETNQIIGRPSWFMGAYNEADEHLYVVDTAKYIMPEKGYDLDTDGFTYLIQLQRSKWTLACKNVHSTVRLEPDQVKWRSNQGKRQWLSGTVIEHMCALIHVDRLVELLEADA